MEDRRDQLEPVLARYFRTGDQEAMEEIVRRTRPRLLAVARRIGKPQDSEDAVQSAYFSLLRKRGEPFSAPVLPWLITAVVRIAYRQKAKNTRQREIAARLAIPPAEPSPLHRVVGAEDAERVHREVARLPARYRDPVMLRSIHGLSGREVCDLLDLPEATLRTRLHRARAMLRSRWPVRVSHGLMVVPWLVADSLRPVGSAVSGGVVPAPLVSAAAVAALATGVTTGAIFAPEVAREAPPLSGAESRLAEAEGLRAEIADLQRRRDEALARRETAAAIRGTEGARADASVDREAGRRDPPFPLPRHARALALVDWSVVGASVVEMTGLVGVTFDHVCRGESLPPDIPGRLQIVNGRILVEAGKLNGRLPGIGANGPFTHPASMANAMAAALRSAGLPLDPEQMSRISREIDAYESADEARRAAYDSDTFELRRRLEECTLKQAFFDAAFEHLAPEQREVLRPERTRGRMGTDLFSGLMLFTGTARHVRFRSEDDLEQRLLLLLVTELRLTREERPVAAEVVRDIVASLPSRVRVEEADGPTLAGWIDLATMTAAVEVTERALRVIQERLGLDEDRRAAIRRMPGPILAVRRSNDLPTEDER